MYLIDTNVWLELLLEQEKAKSVHHLLEEVDPAVTHVTEFTLYSIGILLLRLKKAELFLRFVEDTLLEAGVTLIRLSPKDMEVLTEVAGSFNLDFDDAYQYVAAEKYGLTLVSFDADFDRTKHGRKTPSEVLEIGNRK